MPVTRPRFVIVGFPTHAMTTRLHADLLLRGHHADLVHADRLLTEIGRGGCVVHPFVDGPLPDVVIVTVSTDHVPALHGVARLERAGVAVLNRPHAVLSASDKFQTAAILNASGVPVPLTLGVSNLDSALEGAARIGYPLVLKDADGAEGARVRYISGPAELETEISALRAPQGLGTSDRTPLILQEVVARSLGHDRRIFVVGGAVQAAMDRVARPGEWRSNLSLGASPLPAAASRPEASLAAQAALALGLDFTTIDIMWGDQGPVVIEANPYGDILDVVMTSGLDLIGAVADLAEMRAGARPEGPVVAHPLIESRHQEISKFCLRRLQTKRESLDSAAGDAS